jgi:hypothetical protein
MERLRVNHHPKPLPEGIDSVNCRSAPIITGGSSSDTFEVPSQFRQVAEPEPPAMS